LQPTPKLSAVITIKKEVCPTLVERIFTMHLVRNGDLE
jgi:hypothetical protein